MSIDRRTALGQGAAGLLAASAPSLARATPAAGERPNFLWFISEDNYPVIGAYGDTLARTPTIDRLAQQGILFEHAYVASPVCGASRFSILTGIYPESAGYAQFFGSTDEVLPRDVRGFSTWFRDAGYYCTNTAKENYNSQFDYVDGLWDESSQKAHWSKRAPGQSFLAVFTTMTTHESSQFSGVPGRFSGDMFRLPAYLPDTLGVRGDLASFYNAMEKMDGELAARLAELEKAGIADDTIVFYLSDNGGIFPRGKRFLYELGTRCPLIIYVPPKWQHLISEKPGTRRSDPVQMLDLKQTVLSLAGFGSPPRCEGEALLGPAKGKRRRYAFSGRTRMDERYDHVRSVTDTWFRYIRNYSPHRPYGQHVAFMMQAKAYQDWEAAWRAGTLNPVQARFWGEKPFEELYDLRTDPDQVTNLAGNTAFKAKQAELSAALDAHMLRVNDNGFIPEGASVLGYINSRRAGAYPLRQVMALANLAARRDPANLQRFVAELDNENEVLRYWGAQGLLMLGEAAQSAVPAMKSALDAEQSPHVRVSLCESLVKLTNDRRALRMLGQMLDIEDDGPLRLQAINALAFLGERAKPVLPAIRRAVQEDHRHVVKAAEHLIEVLDGRYDPHRQPPYSMSYMAVDPEVDSPRAPRLYD